MGAAVDVGPPGRPVAARAGSVASVPDLERRLAVSGHLARLEESRHVPGSWTLYVDGTPQSHVELERPEWLGFEYVRRIGHAIDLVQPEGEPITAVHLGGGALTLPRYVAATRPGSRQQVVELESELVDLVREHLPLPRNAQVRVRHGDAREVLAKLPAGLDGSGRHRGRRHLLGLAHARARDERRVLLG